MPRTRDQTNSRPEGRSTTRHKGEIDYFDLIQQIRLRGDSIPVLNGFILLDNVEVLGGRVEELATAWELQRDLATHQRSNNTTNFPRFESFSEVFALR